MFKLKRSGKDLMWYWSLPSGNGELVCQSEGYTSKAMALKGMASVVTNAVKLSIKKALGLEWFTEVVEPIEEVVEIPVTAVAVEAPVVETLTPKARKPRKKVS